MRILIVGAGMFGATCARLLKDAGQDVKVMESSDLLGGMCGTTVDPETNVLRHVYGAHIFHTANEEIAAFAAKFADFRPYQHRVMAKTNTRGGGGHEFWAMPVNLLTLASLFGCESPAEAARAIESQRVTYDRAPENMEESCLAKMGPELYELFFKHYTAKQWGRDPKTLPPSIASRLPFRYSFDTTYFHHPFQAMPADGYTAMIERMLHDVPVDWERFDILNASHWRGYDKVIYTGSVDHLFNYALGVLEYRSLRLDVEHHPDIDDYQGAAVINYTGADVDFTRVIEHKHFAPWRETKGTTISWEYPYEWQRGTHDKRFYPIGDEKNRAIHTAYIAQAAVKFPWLVIGGRLGSYKYVDMDQSIADAFETVKGILV